MARLVVLIQANQSLELVLVAYLSFNIILINNWGQSKPPHGEERVLYEKGIEMNTSTLMLGLIFGSIGFGFFVYGKKQKAIIPLISGIALMVIPYFISNVFILVITGIVFVAFPFFIKRQAKEHSQIWERYCIFLLSEGQPPLVPMSLSQEIILVIPVKTGIQNLSIPVTQKEVMQNRHLS